MVALRGQSPGLTKLVYILWFLLKICDNLFIIRCYTWFFSMDENRFLSSGKPIFALNLKLHVSNFSIYCLFYKFQRFLYSNAWIPREKVGKSFTLRIRNKLNQMWLVRCLAGFRQALRDRTIGLKLLFSFAVAQLIYVIIYQPKTS